MTGSPRYMLDTDICIDILRGRGDHPASRIRRHEINEIAISAITLAELQCGVAKSARPEHHESLLIEFCAPIAILTFDERAAAAYGRTRADLERAGTPIGALDTLIAAHALALNLVLITNNNREFSRVGGLETESWSDG